MSDRFASGAPRRLINAAPAAPRDAVPILNFALTLEHLEADFYSTAVDTRGLLAGSMRDVVDQIRKHEVAHVRFLQMALGSDAGAKPSFDFTAGGAFADVFRNPVTFMTVAQAFEDTGVRAYKGQAAYLMPHRTLLRQALQIHSVEARHASQIRRMRRQKGWITGDNGGDVPAAVNAVYAGENNGFHFILAQPSSNKQGLTEAFDEPLTKGQVLSIVAPFIRGGV